ncbi:MAG: integral rane sensor signal transduction histidine kinase [Edaphobacter sp.]|nr:integral rane sensor signal transduction histidine kinase [Edaphobacter sp.]
MTINLRSLRVRLCMWYVLLTMVSMSALGIFSHLYLTRALASSRQATMQRREDRLVRFMQEEQRINPQATMAESLQHFMLASPDTDVLQVATADGTQIYPQPTESTIPWVGSGCTTPCFGIVKVGEHRLRTLQHTVTLHQREVRLQMAGQIDEHYDILRMVRNSYLIFLPLMLVVSLAGGFVLSHRALEPVDRITRAAHAISIRDLRHRLPVPETGDEIQRLAETWNDVLARLEKAIGHLTQFTSDISHDLRTTVTVMMSTAQLGLRRNRTNEEYCTALRTIALECQSTAVLLDDLLAAARVDMVQQNIDLKPVELSAVVEEVCDHLRACTEMKHQRFETSLAPETWVLGDFSMLRRLANILLDNAVKYTPDFGLISVSVFLQGDRVRLEVRDTGIGIAPSEVGRVFDRFYRADTSRNRDRGGSGLGLAIAKWVVEAHGADITVTSDLLSGSLFSACFPAYTLRFEDGMEVSEIEFQTGAQTS